MASQIFTKTLHCSILLFRRLYESSFLSLSVSLIKIQNFLNSQTLAKKRVLFKQEPPSKVEVFQMPFFDLNKTCKTAFTENC